MAKLGLKNLSAVKIKECQVKIWKKFWNLHRSEEDNMTWEKLTEDVVLSATDSRRPLEMEAT